MTKSQKEYLEALYENCRKHGEDTNEYWEKITPVFQKLADDAHDPELTELAVDYYMQLQREFCEALKGA